MQNNIFITIIIPFYNTRNFIGETLESVKNQKNIDLKSIEILIVDDGSSQNIDDILAIFKNNLNIIYHKKNNGNWGSVINYAKNNNLCRGDYITVMDSDDTYEVDSLQNVWKELTANSPDILVGNFTDWDSKTNKKKQKKIIFTRKKKLFNISKQNKHLFKTPYSFPLGKFYKREIFLKTNNLKENVFYQDINLYYGCLNNSKTFLFLNKTIAHHRNDRIDSSSNIAWETKRLNQWIDVLEYLIAQDAAMNAIFYATVKGFKQKFIKDDKPRILVGKISNCYLPKILYPLAMFYVWYILKTSKVFKKYKS